MDNILNNLGDSIIFKTVPIFNLRALTSFSDTVLGVTIDRTIKRQFCYSMNGVVFTDWSDLNISSDLCDAVNEDLAVNDKAALVLQIMYTRTGTDKTSLISVQEISINGDYDHESTLFPSISGTQLEKYTYYDIDVFNLAVNLAKKMYDEGIVPIYMERNEIPNNLYNDKDYVDFWFVISKMFAVLYKYNIQFTIIYWRKDLLIEFLKEGTILFCEEETDIVTLQMLARNYYDEIRQRGTIEIFRRQGYEYPVGYRNSYNLPTGFLIMPSNPIFINDVAYYETNNLPVGWLKLSNSLIAPDTEYYKIEVLDNSSLGSITVNSDFDYSILDDLPRINLSSSFSLLSPTKLSGIVRKYHGEYLRLICYAMNLDEFMFNVVSKQNRGFCLGHSSPMWRGLRQHENTTIVKGYENFSEEVYDLNYYPIIPPPIPPSGVVLWTSPIRSGVSSSYAITPGVLTQDFVLFNINQKAFYSLSDELNYISTLNVSASISGMTGTFAISGNNVVYNLGAGETWSVTQAIDVLQYCVTMNLEANIPSASPQNWYFQLISTVANVKIVVDFGATIPSLFTLSTLGAENIGYTYSSGIGDKVVNFFHKNINISDFYINLNTTSYTMLSMLGTIPSSVKFLSIQNQKLGAFSGVTNIDISNLTNLIGLTISHTETRIFSPRLLLTTFNSLSGINLSFNHLNAATIDDEFNDFVANTPSFVSGGNVDFRQSIPAPPTSASLAARTSLASAGWTLITD